MQLGSLARSSVVCRAGGAPESKAVLGRLSREYLLKVGGGWGGGRLHPAVGSAGCSPGFSPAVGVCGRGLVSGSAAVEGWGCGLKGQCQLLVLW